MKTKGKKNNRSPLGGKKNSNAYPFEFRLRAVRFYLEEGYSTKLICDEMGMSCHSLYKWAEAYKKYGEEGLKAGVWSGKPKISSNVIQKIVSLKKENPTFGIRRISDILKRFFFMQASSDTVRKTLNEEELIEPPKRKRQKNISKPRFFERATPNQMWQTDICTFRLAGKNAYLIGYIDDYSRYITGLGLFRSQTAEHVIETFRVASGEYGVPKEMLTDNGRQYTNWRGTTKFEKELKKDRIKHIKSQPHHPMTLGKIERFWKTILQEFLLRAQFDCFEDARDRLNFWVKYYNHKRPHQGIGGVCPADRFFEIQHELKQVMAKGVEENTLEMALRGRPRDPFYMVGRLGEQNVVIRAEKGKVRMMVDGEEKEKNHELVYEIEKDNINNESNIKQTEEAESIQCGREGQSSPVPMVRTADSHGSMPGNECEQRPVEQMAAPCDGRSPVSFGIQARPGETTGIEQPGRSPDGEKDDFTPWPEEPPRRETGEHPERETPEAGIIPAYAYDKEEKQPQSGPTTAPGPCADHHAGTQWHPDCNRGRQETWSVPQNLL